MTQRTRDAAESFSQIVDPREVGSDHGEDPSIRILRFVVAAVQGDGLAYARAMRWITFALVVEMEQRIENLLDEARP